MSVEGVEKCKRIANRNRERRIHVNVPLPRLSGRSRYDRPYLRKVLVKYNCISTHQNDQLNQIDTEYVPTESSGPDHSTIRSLYLINGERAPVIISAIMKGVHRLGFLELLLVCATALTIHFRHGAALESYAVSRTTYGDATATFYGGNDASGTMGGSCGYQNPFALGYGVTTAALSNSLLSGNLNCGACFEVKCKYDASAYTRKWCYPNSPTAIITATNLSPPGLNGEHHFDLTYPMFTKIANSIAGRIPIQYRRVRCYRSGGIKFTMTGNPFFNLVLVYNVGGAGNVHGMAIKGSNTNFYPMSRNWGQYWQAMVKLTGQSLTFRVTLGNGKTTTFWNVCPSNWQFGRTYAATYNFY